MPRAVLGPEVWLVKLESGSGIYNLARIYELPDNFRQWMIAEMEKLK